MRQKPFLSSRWRIGGKDNEIKNNTHSIDKSSVNLWHTQWDYHRYNNDKVPLTNLFVRPCLCSKYSAISNFSNDCEKGLRGEASTRDEIQANKVTESHSQEINVAQIHEVTGSDWITCLWACALKSLSLISYICTTLPNKHKESDPSGKLNQQKYLLGVIPGTCLFWTSSSIMSQLRRL